MEVEVSFSIELKSLVQMTGDLSIGGLEIDGHGALDLAGCTLTTAALTVSGEPQPNGTYTSDDFTQVTGTGQIVVFKPPDGTLILLR